MSTPVPASTLVINELSDVDALPELRSIVLLASVPAARNPAEFPSDAHHVDEFNTKYVDTARPERVRAAVSALASVALQRNYRLVFGAHPTISPTILQVAHTLEAPRGSILIFQSAAFLKVIPDITFKLSQRPSGQLILTADKDQTRGSSFTQPHSSWLAHQDPYPHSLDFMRLAMMRVPGVCGAAFIGGMQGVESEARLFGRQLPKLPRYALSSTGSAAERLDVQAPHAFHGTISDPDALRRAISYTVAASLIFDDLDLSRP